MVITGRGVDSALDPGPPGARVPQVAEDDWDRLAGGILAGHIIQCGCQATGGRYTDWEDVPGYENMGYPVVQRHPDGSFYAREARGQRWPDHAAAVIYEQLLYEIGDPSAYVLPDVVRDFRQVRAEQSAA